MSFVHLDCYSDYSLGESVVSIEEIVHFATSQPTKAIALADFNVLFGCIHFYSYARKHGVKPIIGMSCLLQIGNHQQRVTLLAANNCGYANLIKLSTGIYLTANNRNVLVVSQSDLARASEGVICICAGAHSALADLLTNGRLGEAMHLVEWLNNCFGDRNYFAIERIGLVDEEKRIDAMLEIAHVGKAVLVATNPVRFATAKDRELADIRYAIEHSLKGDVVRERQVFTNQQFLRESNDLSAVFDDMPQVLVNSVEIAKRCNVEITLGKPLLPKFDNQDDRQRQRLLTDKSTEGLTRRIITPGLIPQEKHALYQQRLLMELQTIIKMGFTSYFLIVHEFIQWSRENHVTVGPGRGSVAGSLVAYCLYITDVDPLPYDLVFERFLNVERKSMPDIDIDFCIKGRDKVIQHVVDRYGSKAVAQIITFGKMRPKLAVRDAARALGYPHAAGDKVARLVPESPDMNFAIAFEKSRELQEAYKKNDESRHIIDMAKKLEGKVRNIGMHAAGVVIAPGDITDYLPLYKDRQRDAVITQFYKDDLDKIGLVKFDFLGLDTLTTIDMALELIVRHNQQTIDIGNIPLDDPKTLKVLQRGDTIGIFQTESSGMRKYLRNLKPTVFEDIIAMLALYRPGPMDYIGDFIDRKYGRVPIEYPHPVLEEVLAPTYGIAVYQEQVMRIAQRLAGYSLAEADNLRRAMGKKDSALMEQNRNGFIERAIAKGIDRATSEEVFQFIERFASYGFNKSHSAAYAVITFRTAWLKAHFPLAFFASMFTSAIGRSNRLNILYKDCKRHGISIRPPHINYSYGNFEIDNRESVIYGLLAIKSVGQGLVEAIVKEREIAPFTGIFDFVQRITYAVLGKISLESLVCAGAFDGLGMTRAELFANVEPALRLSEQVNDNYRYSSGDLFGGINNTQMATISKRRVSVWSNEEMLDREHKVIGFYLTNHPYDAWRKDFSPMVPQLAYVLTSPIDSMVQVAGAIIDLRERSNAHGKEKLFVIEDGNEMLEARMSENIQTKNFHQIREGNVRMFEGKLIFDSFRDQPLLEVTNSYTYDEARCLLARSVRINMASTANNAAFDSLYHFLASNLNRKGISVKLQLHHKGVMTEIALGKHWLFAPSPQLLQNFAEACPHASLTLEYTY